MTERFVYQQSNQNSKRKSDGLLALTSNVSMMALVCLFSLPANADATVNTASQAPGTAASLMGSVEQLVKKYYPKAKITTKDSSIHFEYKIKEYDIPQTNTIEPGPLWGGVYGNVELKPGVLTEEEASPKQLNQYSYYNVMELHPSSKANNHHLDVHLAYPFDVQPDFLQSFKMLIGSFDETAAPTVK